MNGLERINKDRKLSREILLFTRTACVEFISLFTLIAATLLPAVATYALFQRDYIQSALELMFACVFIFLNGQTGRM